MKNRFAFLNKVRCLSVEFVGEVLWIKIFVVYDITNLKIFHIVPVL